MKIVLYNPRAVFFTMPLALTAVGSAVDRERFEVVVVDGRLVDDPVTEVLNHLDGAVCVGGVQPHQLPEGGDKRRAEKAAQRFLAGDRQSQLAAGVTHRV